MSLVAPVLLLGQALFSRGHVDGVAIGVASALLFLLVVLRMLGLLRQVEEQADQLAALARHDGLTGIPNRRAWDGELPVVMDRARRDGVPVSVALLDLDRFKRFNDDYGHQAGDRLLQSATAGWGAALRTVDTLCRYGGEEFGVLLPGSTAEQAVEVLERLRAVTPLAQTFSAGVACWDGRESSEDWSVAPTARCTPRSRPGATASSPTTPPHPRRAHRRPPPRSRPPSGAPAHATR